MPAFAVSLGAVICLVAGLITGSKSRVEVMSQITRDYIDKFWEMIDEFLNAILFLLIGLTSAVLLYLEQPQLKTAILLAITIWCFCRFYYFAFYVIEHYVDPTYRFSGLMSFARYLWSRRR